MSCCVPHNDVLHLHLSRTEYLDQDAHQTVQKLQLGYGVSYTFNTDVAVFEDASLTRPITNGEVAVQDNATGLWHYPLSSSGTGPAVTINGHTLYATTQEAPTGTTDAPPENVARGVTYFRSGIATSVGFTEDGFSSIGLPVSIFRDARVYDIVVESGTLEPGAQIVEAGVSLELTQAVTADATTLHVDDVSMYVRGEILRLDGEYALVRDTDTETHTLTVFRGQHCTVPSAHNVGTRVIKSRIMVNLEYATDESYVHELVLSPSDPDRARFPKNVATTDSTVTVGISNQRNLRTVYISNKTEETDTYEEFQITPAIDLDATYYMYSKMTVPAETVLSFGAISIADDIVNLLPLFVVQVETDREGIAAEYLDRTHFPVHDLINATSNIRLPMNGNASHTHVKNFVFV